MIDTILRRCIPSVDIQWSFQLQQKSVAFLLRLCCGDAIASQYHFFTLWTTRPEKVNSTINRAVFNPKYARNANKKNLSTGRANYPGSLCHTLSHYLPSSIEKPNRCQPVKWLRSSTSRITGIRCLRAVQDSLWSRA